MKEALGTTAGAAIYGSTKSLERLPVMLRPPDVRRHKGADNALPSQSINTTRNSPTNPSTGRINVAAAKAQIFWNELMPI
jgi:hypothetical protein